MNEAETRAEHIDPALKAAGWGVVEGSRILREYPITPGRIEGLGRRGKSVIADYVLVYRNTKLAVVEAKAWDQALTEGVVRSHMKTINPGGVIRYAADNMRVLNFMLADSLGGGGSASLKTDAQGKTHGLAVLRLEMDIPQSVLDATPAD